MSGKYAEFLATKQAVTTSGGIADPGVLPEFLFPFQKDIVRWALQRGRAAIFADCGLGKTPMQLTWAHVVAAHTGGRVLILAPLAVSQQTVREGDRFTLPVQAVRKQEDCTEPVVITNYEMLDHFDPAQFAGVVLDESSILKSYDSHTRTKIIEAFGLTTFRLACTATPAPNDYMELGNHAEFLGVLRRMEMLAQFFVHDGGETQKWRLKGHAQDTFWKWICQWAVMMRMPSDLGYANDGFVLPPLNFHHVVIESGPEEAQSRGLLIPLEAQTLTERREARRTSLTNRVQIAVNLATCSDEPWILWCDFNAEADALIRAIPGAIQVAGADSIEDKIDRLAGFSEGRYRVLVTKPSIAAFGMNWQHCPNVAFVGLSDSYERFYQAIRRCWRFGQNRPVQCHVITSESEGAVVKNIQRKEAEADTLARSMVEHMAPVSSVLLHGETARTEDEYKTGGAIGKGWEVRKGDCVEVLATVPDDTMDYAIFSPPFASLYTYSSHPRDMGNVRNDGEFQEHFAFLIPHLYRTIRPGRLCSVHCMNLPTSKQNHGVIGLRDFRGDIIRAFVTEGWIYHSEVVIWKDPVTSMQRTKALGLLHKQLKKDACMSRQGIPDYVVTFRKPGENDNRVTNTNESFPVERWQRYASPVWFDITPSNTLQKESAREERDERHICPLQLEVIERCIDLWTNQGDLVLSPFAGIGSEGYVAVGRKRCFLGIELKDSYWRQAVANLRRAEEAATSQGDIFAAADEEHAKLLHLRSR